MNNIENKIKKEFQQREIQPSKQSWENLAYMLDSTKEKKSKKGIIFFKYAAVFIGLLVVASFFFNTDSEIDKKLNKNTELVDINNVKIENDKKEIVSNSNENVDAKIKINLIKDENYLQEKSSVINKNKIYKLKKNSYNNESLAIKEEVNKIKSTIKTEVNLNNYNSIVNNNVVVKKISIPNDEKLIKIKNQKKLMNSSDDDIENMLALALNGKNDNANNSININNDSLQLAIENSLYKNRNTKYKIYKVIKAGVDTVESIIVSNNN